VVVAGLHGVIVDPEDESGARFKTLFAWMFSRAATSATGARAYSRPSSLSAAT
jgi:hypothetical protein